MAKPYCGELAIAPACVLHICPRCQAGCGRALAEEALVPVGGAGVCPRPEVSRGRNGTHQAWHQAAFPTLLHKQQ